MKIYKIFCGLGLLLLAFVVVEAQVPSVIYYQGNLANAAGAPVNTNQNMRFSIWKSLAGTGAADKLWEETQNNVVVKNGLFSVLLGSITPIPATAFAVSPCYLEIVINNETLTPRQQIGSVPYAYYAGAVSGSNVFPASGNVGIGTTSPSAKLDVNGNINLTSAGATVRFSGNNDWRGYLANNVNGSTIGSYLTCGGSFSHKGTTFSSVGDWNGKSNRAAIGIYNQINNDWHNEFRFLSDPGSGTPETWMILKDGKLGIGTASPAQKLEAAGTIYSSQGGFKFPDGTVQTTAATGGGAIGDNLGNHTATKNVNLNGHWLSGDGGDKGIYISPDGHIGIGSNNLATNALVFKIGKTTITIDTSGTIIVDAKNIIFNADMDMKIDAMNIMQNASMEYKIKGMNTSMEAGVNCQVKGTMTTVQSSGPNTIKGSPVLIN